MGVLMELEWSHIRFIDEDAALDAVFDLMEREDELGRGSGPSGSHFAWLNGARPELWESIDDALEDWRLPTEREDNGAVRLHFVGEKAGEEDHLFDAISPYAVGLVVFYYPEYRSYHSYLLGPAQGLNWTNTNIELTTQ